MTPTPSVKEIGDFIDRAKRGNHMAMRAFLDQYPQAVDEKDYSGWTALMYATFREDKETVILLLKYGAAINEVNGSDTGVLLLAAQRGNRALALFLLEKGADIDARNKAGWTALGMAKSCRHHDVVELLEKWPDMQRQRLAAAQAEEERQMLEKEIRRAEAIAAAHRNKLRTLHRPQLKKGQLI